MLTIHNLHLPQSERIVWLCEALQIPYSLKLYQCPPSSRLRHSKR
jgi:glutathione S-transferase